MSRADYVVSCPYCRRQYRMKLDKDEVTQKKTRATCGRCGNSFELAPRITVPGAAALAPPLPPPMARRTPTAKPDAPRVVEFTADSDLDQDVDDLGAAVAAAAEQIAAQAAPPPPPISTSRTMQKIPALDLGPPPEHTPLPPPPPPKRMDQDARATVAHIAVQRTIVGLPAIKDPPADKSSPKIEAQKSSPKVVAQTSSPKIAAQKSSPKIEAPAIEAPKIEVPAPKTWAELADPGLRGLKDEPSPVARALEALL